MDALLMTAALVGLMIAALVLLGRTWPRSSRLGGYRAGRGAGHDTGGGPDAGAPEVGAPEDDDAHWRWTDPGPGPGGDEQR
jgi:hypothetical protein